jgi:hypothetical protein
MAQMARPVKAAEAAISVIMPTIDWGPVFEHCLLAARAALRTGDQLLVVFDGPAPPPPAWLQNSGAVVLQTGERAGPAAARNLAAQQASAGILLFVDADVALHPDAVQRVGVRFSEDSALDALFGSYDATPAAPGLVSQFRNLLHHHTHTCQPGPACTFWAGCGAVRRDRFLALGGFDAETYRQPCIEDVEFGLRLHAAGGQILLDPSIKGTHHKRWTFSLMVRTDICQRAIPWSRLLLRRQQIPSTLNLSATARSSAALSLLGALSLMGLVVPALRPWLLLPALGAPLLVMLLNLPFLAVLRRQGGMPLALAGGPLLFLYLLYSSLSFAGVLTHDLANTSLRHLKWRQLRAGAVGNGLRFALVLLGLLAIHTTIRGIAHNLQSVDGTDLHQRFAEWQLFSDQIYPHAKLASPEQQQLPYFRTSVYLPSALPLFGILFAWGGMWQGKITMVIASLAALCLMGRVGWNALRPWGKQAAWLGALSPLAITGNASCFAHGQFSIVCMGFITMQWLLLNRNQPKWAGICWALAMLKPQIAASFILPFLSRRHRIGLVVGGAVLLGLTAVALSHTQTSPIDLSVSWVQTLPAFIHYGNANFLNLLPRQLQSNSLILSALIIAILTATSCLAIALGKRLAAQAEGRHSGVGADALLDTPDPWALMAICAIIGMVGLHHRHYDNIMLYPAVLSCWRNTLETPRLGNLGVALLISLTVWTPQSIVELLPAYKEIQLIIWLLVGMAVLLRSLNIKSAEIASAK